MRLLIVNSTRKWGGVKTWSLRTACSLSERGHQVTVVGRRGDPFVQACRDAGIDSHGLAFGASWSPFMILSLWRLMRRQQPQLVICNVGRDLSTAGAAAWLRGVPVIHRVGSVHDFRDTFVRRLVQRKLVSAMLTPAEWMVPDLKRRFAWLATVDIRASHHGIDVSRPPVSHSKPPRRLVMVGRLHPEKGQLELLEAAAGLPADLRIVLAGEGPARGELERFASTRLPGRVLLSGFVQDVREVLDAGGIGVLYSSHEAISNVALEYMAAGLPVVASDLPGVRELDPEGEAIRFVAPGDVTALRSTLHELLQHPEECLARGSAGYRRACSRFSREAEAIRLEGYYSEWSGTGT